MFSKLRGFKTDLSFLIWILLFVLVVKLLVYFGWKVAERPSDHFQKSPIKAPVFSFEERGGGKFSSASLAGKIWVVDFIFTSCAGSCPMLSVQMKRLQDTWKRNPAFKLVSFTVDPSRDTTEALRQYADSFQADKDQWVFLTGEKKDLYQTIKDGFKAAVAEDPKGVKGFEFIHTTRMVLVDQQGMIRGYYDGQEEEDMKKLNKDIAFLISSTKTLQNR